MVASGSIVGGMRHVDVGIHQTRQRGRARQVERARVLGLGDGVVASDLRDPAVEHEQRRALDGRPAGPVEQASDRIRRAWRIPGSIIDRIPPLG